jgi:hypothetical protein
MDKAHEEPRQERVLDQAPQADPAVEAGPQAESAAALKAPGHSTPRQISALQRTVGNRAVQRLIAGPAEGGVVQRHVPPEQDATFAATLPALQGTWASLNASSQGISANVESLAQEANALRRAALASRDYPAGSGGGGAAGTGGATEEEPAVPATGGF